MTWYYFTWYELFPQIINMSMTASIIILAVLCVRLLLKMHLKYFRMHYGRLCCLGFYVRFLLRWIFLF